LVTPQAAPAQNTVPNVTLVGTCTATNWRYPIMGHIATGLARHQSGMGIEGPGSATPHRTVVGLVWRACRHAVGQTLLWRAGNRAAPSS